MKRSWIVLVLLLVALVVPSAAHAHGPPRPEPAIVSVDTLPYPWLVRKIHDGYTDEIPWAEAYNDFVDVHAYVPGVSVADAWSYVRDIRHLEEWTMSVRNVQPMGELGGLTRYVADEHLPPGGNIYFLESIDEPSRTVDWWVGHAPEDIWMRYSIRVLDAQEFVGKPGAVITWVNFGHENFQSDPILQQGFLMMKIAHGFERDNLSAILQWRAAGNTGPLDLDTMTQLGLFNVELLDPMQIWGTIAAGVTPTVAWSDHYGEFIGSHVHLPGVQPDEVWAYLSDIDNLEDWTVSLRNIHAVHNDSFRAMEWLAPWGSVRAKTQVLAATRTIDLQMKLDRQCGQQQGYDLNSTLRVLPANQTNGKDGTVVMWIAYHHAALDDSPATLEYWKYLPVRNEFGAGNIAVLLGAAP